MPCHGIPRPDDEKGRSHRAKTRQINPLTCFSDSQLVNGPDVPAGQFPRPRARLEQPGPHRPPTQGRMGIGECVDGEGRLACLAHPGPVQQAFGKLPEKSFVLAQQIGGAHERPPSILAEGLRKGGQGTLANGGPAQRSAIRCAPRPVGSIARILQPLLTPIPQGRTQVLAPQVEKGAHGENLLFFRLFLPTGKRPDRTHSRNRATAGSSAEAKKHGFRLIIGGVTKEYAADAASAGDPRQSLVAGNAGGPLGPAGCADRDGEDLGRHMLGQLAFRPGGPFGGTLE